MRDAAKPSPAPMQLRTELMAFRMITGGAGKGDTMQIGFNLPISGPIASAEVMTNIA
jgi:hypothetical protein